MSDTNSVKEKIMGELDEEGFEFKDVKDPNTYFNLAVSIGQKTFNIFQNTNRLDSILISCRLKLPRKAIESFSRLDRTDKQSFFSNLRIALLTRQSLGDFRIQPNPPDQITEIFISSKPIYYDALTKHRLLSDLNEIYKSVIMTLWMLEETTGIPSLEKELKFTYI